MIKAWWLRLTNKIPMVRDARRYRWLRQWHVDSAVVSYSHHPDHYYSIVECSERFGGEGKWLDERVDHFRARTPRRVKWVRPQ